MGVILALGKQKAFLRDGEWRCADLALEKKLNEITGAWILETGGPKLDAPDPEVEVARELARQTGGRLLLQSKSNAKRAARIYFARRQYKLAFH
jgi:hypothetical protein